MSAIAVLIFSELWSNSGLEFDVDDEGVNSMTIRTIALAALIGLSLSTAAFGADKAAAKTAEPKSNALPALAKWDGPYKNTVIYKFADYGEGVACYVYAPKNVAFTKLKNGTITYTNNNIGNISCVKVTKGRAAPQKK